MKKLLSVFLTLALIFSCLAVFAFSASAEGDPEAYLWFKGSQADNMQPAITFIIDMSEFTDTQYTVFCNARFDEGTTGIVFVNEYSYSNYDHAVASNWDSLLNFKDFALASEAPLGEWKNFEFTWNPSQNDRGVAGEGCAAITMCIGFYMADGGVSVSEMGIKDVDGDVVWSQNFADGLDLTADYIHSYIFPEGQEDLFWGLVGAEINDGTVVEESSEEPAESSVEEPVEESEDDTPSTGDSGIIALAVISVIALAGAIVIKRK